MSVYVKLSTWSLKILTLVDFREVKSNKETQTKFNVFWDEVQKFINEVLGVAVDDRCHGEITHLAKAICIRDLREQVSTRCPPGTPRHTYA